jgi:RNA-directed DNA polymerase
VGSARSDAKAAMNMAFFNLLLPPRFTRSPRIDVPDLRVTGGVCQGFWTNYGLQVHPGKIRLEHHSKGVAFLGAQIKPGRITAGSRVKGNFFDAITGHNALTSTAIADRNIRAGVIASINSYLGFLVHYSTVRLRRSMLAQVAPVWWAYLRVEGKAHKVVERARPARST